MSLHNAHVHTWKMLTHRLGRLPVSTDTGRRSAPRIVRKPPHVVEWPFPFAHMPRSLRESFQPATDADRRAVLAMMARFAMDQLNMVDQSARRSAILATI